MSERFILPCIDFIYPNSSDPQSKFSILKFGSSKIDFADFNKAEINETCNFKLEKDDKNQTPTEHLKPIERKIRKRKIRDDEKMSASKSIILTMEKDMLKKKCKKKY
ncbi:LOW QUALITY PROTEIN: hypothetical protein HZS_679 [Henneguya salminicola]|nr:LOW QUALITY PROTEIN: hypothetical protein HZS_679 [Henneguya salminicola]